MCSLTANRNHPPKIFWALLEDNKLLHLDTQIIVHQKRLTLVSTVRKPNVGQITCLDDRNDGRERERERGGVALCYQYDNDADDDIM